MTRFLAGGLLGTRYTLTTIGDGASVLIDAPEGIVSEVKEFLRETDTRLEAILLTHGHFDHIAGLGELEREFGPLDVYLDQRDEVFLTRGNEKIFSLPSFYGAKEYYTDKLSLFSGKTKRLEGKLFSFSVIHTPGHTPGSVVYYDEKNSIAYTGDTIFQGGGIGRTDMTYSSFSDEITSIRNNFSILVDDVMIVPGHGSNSTIGEERKYHN